MFAAGQEAQQDHLGGRRLRAALAPPHGAGGLPVRVEGQREARSALELGGGERREGPVAQLWGGEVLREDVGREGRVPYGAQAGDVTEVCGGLGYIWGQRAARSRTHRRTCLIARVSLTDSEDRMWMRTSVLSVDSESVGGSVTLTCAPCDAWPEDSATIGTA